MTGKQSNGVDLGRVAAPHTERAELTASVNAIRQMGWLLGKQGAEVRPLAHCMLAEPVWFARQIGYDDLCALVDAAKACNRRCDTRALMMAFLPAGMVARWCPPRAGDNTGVGND